METSFREERFEEEWSVRRDAESCVFNCFRDSEEVVVVLAVVLAQFYRTRNREGLFVMGEGGRDFAPAFPSSLSPAVVNRGPMARWATPCHLR